jgi:hypothetical protein
MFTDEKRQQLRKALLAETTDWDGAAREFTFVDVARAAGNSLTKPAWAESLLIFSRPKRSPGQS